MFFTNIYERRQARAATRELLNQFDESYACALEDISDEFRSCHRMMNSEMPHYVVDMMNTMGGELA